MKARVIKTGEIVDVYHEPQHGQITNIYKESVLVNGGIWTEDELDFCVKTSEAPEKIYLEAIYPDNGVLPNGLNYTPSSTDVEYTRTDVLIKKAENYLNSKLYDWVQITNPNQRSYANTIIKQDFIEDFKNYMKGE